MKFKQSAAAEECISVMRGRFFGGRQIQCDFWDNVTNYMVKEKEVRVREARNPLWVTVYGLRSTVYGLALRFCVRVSGLGIRD